MTDYDVAVGGVYDNGSCYLQDYLTIGQERPQLDLQQDWILINCSEDNGVTTLFFCRAKNTSDENDTVVEEGKSIYIIWAYHDTTDVTDMSFPQHTVRGFDNKTLCPAETSTSSSPSISVSVGASISVSVTWLQNCSYQLKEVRPRDSTSPSAKLAAFKRITSL
ncbi:hypothetical protein ACROYT_G012758 [Oculina patagonica]